jgi:hypothetical protein
MDLSKLSDQQLLIANKVAEGARNLNIDPDYALAVAWQESRFDPNARSKKDAFGVMQLMPDTAKELNVDRSNVDDNIIGGLRYLKQNLQAYDNDKMLAAIAYNAGPNHKYFETKDIKDLPDETLDYLDKINAIHPFQPIVNAEAKDEAASKQPVPSRPETNPNLYGVAGSAAGVSLGSVRQVRDFLGGRSENRVKEMAEAMRRAQAAQTTPTPQGNVTVQGAPPTAGDKWSNKVVGGMGPGGASVSEAARNYRIQQGLTPEEAAQWKANRQGLILPNKEAMAQESVERMKAELQAAREKSISARTGNAASSVGRIAKAAPVLNLPLSLGGAGYQGAEAYNRYQRGMTELDRGNLGQAMKQFGGAAISGVGAGGALASLAPNPIVKGAGVLTNVAAPFLLEAYDIATK